MSDPAPKSPRPTDPLNPPYEITLPHPEDEGAEPPAPGAPEDVPPLSERESPLGDYVRELQQEYDEQMDEGKL